MYTVWNLPLVYMFNNIYFVLFIMKNSLTLDRHIMIKKRSNLDFFLNFLLIFFISCVHAEDPPIKQLDSQEFIGDYAGSGYTAAFGDINEDKQTDLFVISGTGKKILVFIGSSTPPYLALYQTVELDYVATSLVPADFNGDSFVDLLVTRKTDDSLCEISIIWGIDDGKLDPFGNWNSTEKFIDEPLLLDANSDTISDLFVVYSNYTRGFLVGQEQPGDWNFINREFKMKTEMKLNNLFVPHSNGFIDLFGDRVTDLFLTSVDKDKQMVYELWQGSPAGLVLSRHISLSDNDLFSNVITGPVAFTDVNADGIQDIVVATCVEDGNNGCKEGKILWFHDDNWNVLFATDENWKFPNSGKDLPHVLNVLHMQDFNLDSYPDVLLILQNKMNKRRAVILYNQQCSTNFCSNTSRQMTFTHELPDSDDVITAGFYDFSMDGTLDVIISTKSEEKYKMKAYMNNIVDDVMFLRVQILPGHSDAVNYGVNVPGPFVKYETTNLEGGSKTGSIGQLSQSAHLSLQLPYIIFGLGRMANYVDKLIVTLPTSLVLDDPSQKQRNLSSSFRPLNRTWPMLIPNSQIYVIPYPLEKPKSWKNILLVTPSQNVVMTGIVLLGTCGVLGISIMILHWMERREDKKEKIQEAYRFHFDAM